MFSFVLKTSTSFSACAISFRYVRSRTMRDKRLPKLVKGSVTTLKDEPIDDFRDIRTHEDLDRKLKSMFIEPDDFQREIEIGSGEDFSDVFEKQDELYDIHKREERDNKKIIRKHILRRNFFKEPQETNLLTHAAKIQVRYLHYINPEEWTPQKLAECFPISVSGVKKLLNCTKVYLEVKGEAAIKAHDDVVAERWKCLKRNQNLSQFSPVTLKLWREGKLVQDFYAGNATLPQPEIPKEHIVVKPKKVGEFAAMVKKYVDAKHEKEQKLIVSKDGEKNVQEATMEADKSKNDKTFMNSYMKRLSQNELEDETSPTYLATDKIDPTEPDILSDQFEENLLEEYADKKNKTPSDIAYYEWMKENKSTHLTNKNNNEAQPCDFSDVITKTGKFNTDVIELRTDYLGKSKIPYLYNSRQGYQYPFGKDIVQYKIKIPKKLHKKGATFRVGQSFYDDRGYFMYKIPVEIKVK